ncbi:hypothetical protein B0A68_02940 [Flavobacterium reichenbachii]|uniref:Uncharacterized protein n=1 Tax=Flavobacterium reichenbachii TaxID=362418 RepID=A0A085ZMA8_9FLAO|nr:hypothetical protein IW19_08620 [Flavobacterium reichenbachii]OXB17909.1 hypothetical protein B0A68_02940 [Flavobacterium reichenbachii]
MKLLLYKKYFLSNSEEYTLWLITSGEFFLFQQLNTFWKLFFDRNQIFYSFLNIHHKIQKFQFRIFLLRHYFCFETFLFS